jgi:hypothetical protein
MKYPSDNTLDELPTQRISQPLTGVMKSLVGGSIPSYDDISTLSSEDKTKLHHILHHSRFEKFNIAHPNKTEEEQKMDRFNILKGELIAGNTNDRIRHELKLMVVKFMNEGRIPRLMC